jgi:LacI family transcriptional regulator
LFINKGIPLIFFDRIPDGIESDTVSGDNYSGAYGIVEHFIQQGYKRIAHFAGPLNIIVAASRLQGYKDALRDYGIPFDPTLVYEVGFERKHGIEAAEQLVAEGNLPDAIFCVSDPVAIGLMLTLKKHGIAIPGEVAVAGFNDDPTATVIDPPLTTVIQPAFEMGASAADIFLARKAKIATEKTFDKRVHATTLQIRGSSVKTS